MDTMTLTKVAAGFCGAFLVLLLGKWAGEGLFHVGGHGDHAQAYVIDTGEEEDAGDVEEVSFEEVLASADIAAGAKVFKKCSACHKVEDGANSTGPHLYGVVGRYIAAEATTCGYSGALRGIEGDWTADNLNGFLAKPKDWAEGTTMGFAGLKKIEDRANVIAYLDSLDD